MKVNELNNLLLGNVSGIVKNQSRDLLEKGQLKKLEGKKYNETYSLYGEGDGFKSYIRINIKKKQIEKLSCSCLEFNELSKVKSDFMCKHIVSTSMKFLGKVKNSKDIKSGIIERPISKIIRKVKDNKVFYEGRRENGDYRIHIDEGHLRGVLSNINKKTIKFTYDFMEIIAPLKKHNIPMRYNFKGDSNTLVITTYKKLPRALNTSCDVWFFNNEIYLPYSNQVKSLIATEAYFKEKKEIRVQLTMENIIRGVELFYNEGCELVFDCKVMNLIKDNVRGEFHLFEKNCEIYLEVYIYYGRKRFNIFTENKSGIRNSHLEDVFLTKVYGCGFKGLDDKCIFIGGEGEKLRLIENKNSALNSLGEVLIDKSVRGGIQTLEIERIFEEV